MMMMMTMMMIFCPLNEKRAREPPPPTGELVRLRRQQGSARKGHLPGEKGHTGPVGFRPSAINLSPSLSLSASLPTISGREMAPSPYPPYRRKKEKRGDLIGLPTTTHDSVENQPSSIITHTPVTHDPGSRLSPFVVDHSQLSPTPFHDGRTDR
jgi:hypothetical protein